MVLTRIDGDSRGGAALSIRAVTGKPIKLMGVGEKLDALEAFHPDRIAGRILDMGDVVSLVEKAAETVDQEEAEKLAKKWKRAISISTIWPPSSASSARWAGCRACSACCPVSARSRSSSPRPISTTR